MKTKTVYAVLTGTEEQKYYVDFANAVIFRDANPGAEIFTEDITEEEFKNHAATGLFEDYQENEPDEQKEPEQPKETGEIYPAVVDKKKVTKDQLLQINENLQKEVERLKASPTEIKIKKIDFFKASQIYERKVKAMQELKSFEKLLADVESVRTYKSAGLDAENVAIVYKAGSNMQNLRDVLQITNYELVNEFNEFIRAKLQKRIDTITEEIETVDFI